MRLAIRFLIPGAIVALTLAACASSATAPSSAAPATSAAATAAATGSAATGDAVTIKGFAFSPATLTVKKGTTVTFVNMDSATHTVTSGSGGTKDGKFDQSIDGGGAAKITFDTVGTFSYFCTIHASMRGTITVQ